MADFITLTASDGHTFNGYRADPAGPPKGAVVVIQEIFGVNHQIRETCHRFAREGYVAVAPAIQDRLDPGFETDDYSAIQPIREMMSSFDPDKALLDVEAAIATVRDTGKIGITGYCLGGAITWRAAHAGLGLAAASGYYGGGIDNYIDLAPAIPTEMHYGEEDAGIPLEKVEALRQRYPQVDVYLYPAGHGFFNDERPQSYDRNAAETAFARTLAFFAKHVAAT